MAVSDQREQALEPEDVGRLFLQRLNASDADGLARLYEPDAVLAAPSGQVTIGREAIRRFYAQMLANRPTFEEGKHKPVLRLDDVALTSTRLVDGTVTVEVLRQQNDGTWLMAIDHPDLLGEE